MSRSNPHQTLPNPCSRWMKYNGSKGKVTYYDKLLEKTVEVPEPFAFTVLDVLASVRGWDEEKETDIFSNEIRNIVTDTLVVRRRQGEKVATGVYSAIKDVCNLVGGEFHSNLYLAYKDGTDLKIGALRLKGAAVGAWMAFEKKNRAQLYEQAIVINGSDEHTHNGIKYKTPKFALAPLKPESHAAATALDVELQAYLRSVQTASKPLDTPPPVADADTAQPDTPVYEDPMALAAPADIYEDDIPF